MVAVGVTNPAASPARAGARFTAEPPKAGRDFDGLPQALREPVPVGCRLRASLPAWAAITGDAFVLSVICNGFMIDLVEPLPGGALWAYTHV